MLVKQIYFQCHPQQSKGSSYLLQYFTPRQLQILKLWVEGKSNTDIQRELVVGKEAININFYRMRKLVDAQSNIQVVAVAIREGALRPYQEEDGFWAFGTFHQRDRKRLPLGALIFPPAQQ